MRDTKRETERARKTKSLISLIETGKEIQRLREQEREKRPSEIES